jgi:hypothetical protein
MKTEAQTKRWRLVSVYKRQVNARKKRPCEAGLTVNYERACEGKYFEGQCSQTVAGIAFRTSPRDDTGVPHILEHTVLCGSARFPVRDPFFKMLTAPWLPS